ncbi:TniQ family protein [Kitasatospora sp. NPDC094011]|uniref:TniQ family protein n=1 Tax=Kitasatospora sp. NPDC094011 TaxID=3364090 RepID=UPI00381B9261
MTPTVAPEQRETAARRLPTVPLPLPGEALLSWIDHFGAEYGLRRKDAACALGIPLSGPGATPFIGLRLQDLTFWLTDRAVSRLKESTGLPTDILTGMSLRQFDNGALRFRWWRSLPVEEQRPRGCLNRSENAINRDKIPVCPKCLHENGFRWKLEWYFPWIVLCPDHLCYLVAHCPVCNSSFRPSMGYTPATGLCEGWVGFTGPHAASPSSDRKYLGWPTGGRCPARPAEFPTQPVRDNEMITSQKRIRETILGEDRDAARNLIEDLRSLLPHIFRATEPEHLENSDDAVRRNFLSQRDHLAKKGYYPAKTATPFEPLTMAAGLTVAAPIIWSEDPLSTARSILPPSAWANAIDPAEGHRLGLRQHNRLRPLIRALEGSP